MKNGNSRRGVSKETAAKRKRKYRNAMRAQGYVWRTYFVPEADAADVAAYIAGLAEAHRETLQEENEQ